MATDEREFEYENWVQPPERRVPLSKPVADALRGQDPRFKFSRTRLTSLNHAAEKVWMPGGGGAVVLAVFEIIRAAYPELGRTARAEAMELVFQFGGREGFDRRPNTALVAYAGSCWAPYLRCAEAHKARYVQDKGIGWMLSAFRAGRGKRGYVKPVEESA